MQHCKNHILLVKNQKGSLSQNNYGDNKVTRLLRSHYITLIYVQTVSSCHSENILKARFILNEKQPHCINLI